MDIGGNGGHVRALTHRLRSLWATYANGRRAHAALVKAMTVLRTGGPVVFARQLVAKLAAPHRAIGETERHPNAEEDARGYAEWRARHVPRSGIGVGAFALSALIIEDNEPEEWRRRTRARLEAMGIRWAVASDDGLETTKWRIVIRAGEVLDRDGLASVLEAGKKSNAGMIFADHDYLDDCGKLVRPYFKGQRNVRLTLSTPEWLGPCLLRTDACWWGGGARRVELLASRTLLGAKTVEHVPSMMAHLPLAAKAAVRSRLRSGLRRLLESEPGMGGAPDTRCWRHGAVSAPVSVVVPFRGRPGLLAGCLEAIVHGGHDRTQIVLVCNGGMSSSIARLARRVGAVVIDRPGPFNFSALCNAGAAQADGDVLLFLNNDVALIQDGWVLGMLREYSDPSVGVVGNLLLYPDGTVQHAGVALGFGTAAGHLYRYYDARERGYHGTLQAARDCFAVTGACLMIRRAALDEVGGWDERLPVDFNDVLLCARVWNAGGRVVWTPHSQLMHLESQTRQRRVREEDLYAFRQVCPFQVDPFYSPHLRKEEPGFEFAAFVAHGLSASVHSVDVM